MGTRFIEGFTFNLFSVYLLAYVATNLELPRAWALDAIIVGAALGVVLVPLSGALSDKVGRKPVYRAGAWLGLLFAFPAACARPDRGPVGDLAGLRDRASASSTAPSTARSRRSGPSSSTPATATRPSARSTRSPASSPPGSRPLIAAWLVTRGDGTLWWVAAYNVLVAVISLVCARFLPETRGRGLDRVDAAVEPAPRERVPPDVVDARTEVRRAALLERGASSACDVLSARLRGRRLGDWRRAAAPRRRRTTSQIGRPSSRATAAKGSSAPTTVVRTVTTAPSALVPPSSPARKPAGSSSSSGSSSTASWREMSTVMVDSEVWSASQDCCDLRESSSAWRLVSCDSIQMMSLSVASPRRGAARPAGGWPPAHARAPRCR